MQEHPVKRQLSSEFAGCKFGDSRLSARLHAISSRLFPGTRSFPKMFCDPAELEGAYRFFSNHRVRWKDILEGHFRSTFNRIDGLAEVTIAHDTTPFLFEKNGPDREGLGRVYGSGKTHQGFLGHFSLAVESGSSAMPLGLVAARFIVRPRGKKQKALPKEFGRWAEQVAEVEGRYRGRARLVHVMDREGDSYALFDELIRNGSKFVIRMRRNRHLRDGLRLYEEMDKSETFFEKEILLSKRLSSKLPRNRKHHSARKAGKTQLCISAKSVVVSRPANAKQVGREFLKLNVVHVREKTASPGCQPIDWKLATSEPIGSVEDLEKIVEHYQRRWVIEEYFKSLKTGCLYQARQQGTLHALLNVLAIFLPVAWWILRLRKIGLRSPTMPSEDLISELQKQLLARRFPESAHTLGSVNGLLLAIARLGGHIKYSGPPGWQLIYSGYRDLLLMEAGILIMDGAPRSTAISDKR